MIIISIVCFVLLLIGTFILFNLTPKVLSENMDELADAMQTTDISKIAKKAQSKKKQNAIAKFFSNTYYIMTYMKSTGKFVILCFISISMAIFGSIIVNEINKYCVPAVILGCCSLPFIFVHKTSYNYTRATMKELELTLTQITNSYIRTEKIMESVEENLKLINPPIKKYFVEFINQLKYVSPNEKQAIEDLSEKIDDNVFKEWCDGFKKCSSNRTLKYLLKPSLEKYTTIKNLDAQVKREIFEIKLSFYISIFLVYSNYLLLYFINKDWFAVLSSTSQGFMCTGFIVFLTVLSLILLFFITKPIKYKI